MVIHWGSLQPCDILLMLCCIEIVLLTYLQRSPRPPSWITGGLLLREGEGTGKGRGEEERERERRGKEGRRGKGDVAPPLSQILGSAPDEDVVILPATGLRKENAFY